MNEQRKKAKLLIQTAKGQTETIINMLDENRYCVDISNQILAVQSLLKKANILILEQHIKHCVKEAVQENREKEKLEEITNILNRLI
ncbi:MAG TPA: metal-sensing transcriptional repressor [Bacilli bacterium]|jgi:DNA-binding FrmR family transcriptional regulator|nr:metal-sensing transcriptional repressor [Acholeplasmataceae bacterium]OQB62170.1 MAG: Copper-sensing transcriptional repressor CsoR [Tenericutes bacterium ADurb.Bin140]HOE77710.1 metal-sensing transcriptional repressor [Bacilli bacterium]HON64124.1 metal-sensing transcriptional repressor [Bacilli bacterium]HOR95861.1 metal-sensing transcriptional repressor [Bacilli bacterium]